MTEEEILAILMKFSDYLEIGDLFKNGFRVIGMLIAEGLIWFVDTITGNFTQVLSVLNFRNNDAVKELLALLQPIQSMLLGIAILAVGVVLYLGKNAEMRNIPLNVFLIICTLSMLPNLVTQGVRLTEAIGSDVVGEAGGLGFKAFKNNTVDVYELGAKGWTTDQLEERNYLEDLKFFDINERITDAKKVDPDGVLDYEAVNKINGKGYEVKKIKGADSVLDFFVKLMVVPTYYRWRVFWIPALITLFALAGATGLFVLRAGKISIEIAFNYIWTNITAFAHIRDLRKFKQACFDIFIGLITLASLIVMFYLYIAFNTFVSNGSEHILVKALLYVGGAWFLFDGPAIIQKQLGIDAGLSTAGGIMAGLGAGKAVGAVGNTVKAGAGAAAGGAGLLVGLSEALNSGELAPDKRNNKNNKDDDGLFNDNDPSDGNEDSAETEGKNEGINDQLDGNDDKSKSNNDSDSTPGEQQESDSDESTSTDSPTDDTGGVTDELDDSNSSPETESTSPMDGIEDSMPTNTSQETNSSDQPTNAIESNDSNASQDTTDTSESKKEPKKPVKPKNPVGSFIKDEIMTPKYQKNRSTMGNMYESGSKGRALGKDLVEYTKEKRAYKEAKRDYDSFKKDKGEKK